MRRLAGTALTLALRDISPRLMCHLSDSRLIYTVLTLITFRPPVPPDASSWADTMSLPAPAPLSPTDAPPPQADDVGAYKLYKWRFVGLVGIVRHFSRNCADAPLG